MAVVCSEERGREEGGGDKVEGGECKGGRGDKVEGGECRGVQVCVGGAWVKGGAWVRRQSPCARRRSCE